MYSTTRMNLCSHDVVPRGAVHVNQIARNQVYGGLLINHDNSTYLVYFHQSYLIEQSDHCLTHQRLSCYTW